MWGAQQEGGVVVGKEQLGSWHQEALAKAMGPGWNIRVQGQGSGSMI